MTHSSIDYGSSPAAEHARWRSLYLIAAVAAWISVAVIVVSMLAFFIWPPFPDDILTVIQQDKLAGLMGLDLLYLLGNAFGIPFFIVLYVTLKRVDEGWAVIALALAFIGLVSIIIARPILEVVTISDRLAVATTEAQRAISQASGEAMLSLFHGTAFNVHYVLGSASLLISSLLMLRSDLFSKSTAWVGIVTNVVVFGLYVPQIGVYLSLLSVVGYLIWYILVARRLLRLGREAA